MNQQAPPVCNVCGTPQNWVPPGISRTTGLTYEGFWGCPNRKNHPAKSPQSAGYPQTTFQNRQAAQAAPQATNGHGVTRDTTGRSIEAQAACKAACVAFAGAGQQGSQPVAQREWIVALAQTLLAQVITPAVEGRQPGEDADLEFMR